MTDGRQVFICEEARGVVERETRLGGITSVKLFLSADLFSRDHGQMAAARNLFSTLGASPEILEMFQ